MRPHILLIFVAIMLAVSCTTSTHLANKPLDSVPSSQTIDVTDEALADHIIQFLALSKSDDPAFYETQRRKLETLLLKLSSKKFENKTTLRFHRDGLTFLLPIQFIQVHGTNTIGKDIFRTDYEPVLSKLEGEVLDLAWLPGETGSVDKLIALFADSIMVVMLPDESIPHFTSLHFPENSFRKIRAAYPTGIFSRRDAKQSTEYDVAVLTSSLQFPLIWESNNSKLREVKSSDLRWGATWPTSWFLPEGRNLYFSRKSNLVPFLSLREASNSRMKILLDESGYLKLFSDNLRFPDWTSERPWGNRLFLLEPDLLAVCDNRRESFVVFQLQKQKLKLLGQSPHFGGAVSAITSAKFRGKKGLIISLTDRHSHIPTSNFYFISDEKLTWSLPIRFAEPQFPDYKKRLDFVLDRSSLFEKSSGCIVYPSMVISNVYETLFQLDAKGKIWPKLVIDARPDSSWQIWTVQLRRQILFADGSALTADVVRNSWQYNFLNCYRNQCASGWLWKDITGADQFISGRSDSIAGLRVIDNNTLQIRLDKAIPKFVENLTHTCFAVMKKSGNKGASIGTGPYQFESININEDLAQFSSKPNIFYRGGHPSLQQINFVFKNVNLIDALSNRDFPGTLLRRKNEVEYFREVSAVNVSQLTTSTIYFLTINPWINPISNRAFRQYLVTSILNREELANIITEAECKVAPNFFVPLKIDFGQTSKPPVPKPTRAISIAFRSRDGVARQIAERLAARMSQSRIPAHAPRGLGEEAFETVKKNSDYDILIDSITPTFATGVYNLAQLLNSGYVVDSSIYDKLENILSSPSLVEAEELERTLIEEVWFYPLVSIKNYVALPFALQGVKQSGGLTFDFSKAWLPK